MQSIGVGDLSVSTNKIQTGAVTSDKIAEGAVGTVDIADASITAAKMSGAQSGSAPAYAARAWVNFNGTGTVAIRASGNVTSITDGGVGFYLVNFTNAMPDVNYAVATAVGNDTVNNTANTVGARTVSSVRAVISNSSGSLIDDSYVAVSVFR
jgi:hypothetical protein